MRLIGTDLAVKDLEELRLHVEADNSRAAKDTILRILSTVKRLPKHPRLGRPGRVEGTRELVVPTVPYLVAYQLHGETITLLRVLHASRQWPTQL